MASTEDATATAATETVAANDDVTAVESNSVNDVQINDTDESTPKRAKVEGESSPVKRTRSATKSKGPDAVMMAEAKAAFGDLDTSEGRRLRKRSSDPVKVEEKKPTPKRSSSRRKSSTKAVEQDEEEEEAAAADTHTAEKNGSNEDHENSLEKTDRIADDKSKEESVKSAAAAGESANDANDDGVKGKAKDEKESELEDGKKSDDGTDELPAEDGDKKIPSEDHLTSD